MTRFRLLLLILLLVSVAHARAQTQTQDLTAWSEQILKDFSSPDWKNETCVSSLQQLGSQLDQINPAASGKSNLAEIAPQLIDRLWRSRLALHEHLSTADNDCAREIRNTFRRFRFLEDVLGEIVTQAPSLDPLNKKKFDFKKQPVPIDEKTNGYLLQTRDSNFDLRPGDLIVARGVSYLSAMISRLGDIDSQFSHVIMVTENPKTHAIETIESYVGVGVAIYDRKTALQNENARLLVLRPKDAALAKRASEEMRALVASRTGNNKIYYDYALNFDDSTTMSCAEVAKFALDRASNGSFQLPERASNLSRGLDLVKSLGVEPGKTFTPGDLEYDSRFDIVGEWRDLRITRDSRVKDAILTKALEWMDQDAFTLHPSFKSKLASGLIYKIRRTIFWPVVKFALHLDNFSKEIPSNMVGTVTLIGEFGTKVQAELQKRDLAHEAKTGFAMTYLDLYRELEVMRAEEETAYAQNPKTLKKSLILKYLRSDEN
jgi:hypothetical protein